jgi:hypothetical protein
MDNDSISGNAGEHQQTSEPTEEEVRLQLERILRAPEFKAAHRCHDFLQFVVEQTLACHTDSLKERTIGIEAFGRPADYDTNEDSVVRVKASEVRKRLTHYYAGSGKDDPVFIELPVGNYVPRFSWCSARGHEGAEIANSSTITSHASPHPRKILRWAIGAAVLVAAVVSLASWRLGLTSSVLDEFWAPVLDSPNPLLVVAAFVPGYVPEVPSALESTTGKPPVRGFTLLQDQFVGGGDLLATAQLAGMLAQKQHRYSIRIDSTMSFADLRDTSSVLIGYASTRWAQVSRDLRYFVDDSLEISAITDHGRRTEWVPRNYTKDYHTDEDYAIVTRVNHPQTHSYIVIATGCTQYGTQAAAELITRNDLLKEALRGAPQGWQKKNLQLVVKVRVIGNSPASPKVVASQYW